MVHLAKGARKVAVEEARMVSQRAGAVVPEPEQCQVQHSPLLRFPPMPGPFTAAMIGFGNSMNTLNIFSLCCLEILRNLDGLINIDVLKRNIVGLMPIRAMFLASPNDPLKLSRCFSPQELRQTGSIKCLFEYSERTL